MYFFGKWKELENILCEITEHSWYAVTDKWEFAQELGNTQDKIHNLHEAQEERRLKCQCFSPSRKGEQSLQ